jgi:hypothetical protein
MDKITYKNSVNYFSHNDWGNASDVHVVNFHPPVGQSFNQFKRDCVDAVKDYINDYSYPDHTGSSYDCTGLRFRSRWKRLAVRFDDYGLSVVLQHDYSIDI